MLRLHAFLPAFFCLCVSGCSLFDLGSPSDSDDAAEVEPIIIADLSKIRLASDPFEVVEAVGLDTTTSEPFIPGAVMLTSDTLALRVAYGGGCAAHRFRLYASYLFSERHPVASDVFLAHDNGGDTCEAYISEEVRFDLTPLKETYQEGYRREHGIIDMIFYLGAQERLVVRYAF